MHGCQPRKRKQRKPKEQKHVRNCEPRSIKPAACTAYADLFNRRMLTAVLYAPFCLNIWNDKVQFSSIPRLIRSSGGHNRRLRGDPLQVFSAAGHYEQFWHALGCPLFDVVHPAFPLRPRRRPPSRVPWRMIFERLSWRVTCPNRAKFSSLDSCQKRFLWTHKEVDLAPHPVIGLVLQAGDADKLPQALGFESLDLFFFFSASSSMVHVIPKRRSTRSQLEAGIQQ